MNESINFSVPVETRFADFDAMGHVNNARFLTYMEQGRMNYFDTVFGNSIDWQKRGFILGRAEIDYKRPILMRDKVTVYIQCSKIGNKSIHIKHRIIVKNDSGNEKDAALGIAIIVAYDYVKGNSIPIPDEWKKKILNFEQNPEIVNQ